MDRSELKENLEALGITQADLARLLDVTSRGVALWMVGDRSIPGPVSAYVRLLRSLPMNLRQVELGRLRERKVVMRNGMYVITFQAGSGRGNDAGVGVLTFEDGIVYGVDEVKVKYDGDYTIDETGMAHLRLKVTYPPGVRAVFGVQNPYEWSIDVTAILDPTKDQGEAIVNTSVGAKVKAQYRFMRPLPAAA